MFYEQILEGMKPQELNPTTKLGAMRFIYKFLLGKGLISRFKQQKKHFTKMGDLDTYIVDKIYQMEQGLNELRFVASDYWTLLKPETQKSWELIRDTWNEYLAKINPNYQQIYNEHREYVLDKRN